MMGLFAKVSITDEVAAVGALEELPDISLSVAEERRIKRIKTETELDYLVVIKKSTKVLITYRVSWAAVIQSEMFLIQSFWESHLGNIVPFLWDGPSGQFSAARKFHFTSPIDITKLSPDVYSISTTVEELFLGP